MKGSLIIISFFILGVLLGRFNLVPWVVLHFDFTYYTLLGLLFFVGVSIGNNPDRLKQFTQLERKLLLLPLTTLLGTWGGVALVTLCLSNRSLPDGLAVGSGFGYYSLSSIFIHNFRGAELGTVALLSNIIREILTLLLAPLMVRWFGPLAPISSGGATTMDTTLPIIIRTSGEEYTVLSLYHGFLVDFSVPFLVTFFCSIA